MMKTSSSRRRRWISGTWRKSTLTPIPAAVVAALDDVQSLVRQEIPAEPGHPTAPPRVSRRQHIPRATEIHSDPNSLDVRASRLTAAWGTDSRASDFIVKLDEPCRLAFHFGTTNADP